MRMTNRSHFKGIAKRSHTSGDRQFAVLAVSKSIERYFSTRSIHTIGY
ncbi:hypothetical protein H6F67_12255 [Microcoleus sp. FACHB-1515]|nr:hypothetical protein [Microcoleus sp. FACHB-1515]MBD2090626.1 hypothetical protein [Microcoleus sp. FACHB-1515]